MKQFRVLVLTQGLTADISTQLNKTKEYEMNTLGLDLVYDIQEVNIDLKWKSFGIYKMMQGTKTNMFGLDGAREQLRKYINRDYHAVIFVYDTKFFNSSLFNGSLGNFTHFNEIIQGIEFIEVATNIAGVESNDLHRILTHEIRHCYVNRCRRAGIPMPDVMDCTFTGDSECIPYHKEWEVEAPDGNRATQNVLLTPHLDTIVKLDSFVTKLIRSLLQQILFVQSQIEMHQRKLVDINPSELPVELPKKSRLEDWANAIKIEEGWKIGSCSYRNNNPGNLRYSKYQIGYGICGSSGTFSLFKDYATGWKALLFQLEIAANGKSSVYKPTMTLMEFFAKYAPAKDNNYPERYAKKVAARLGVSPDIQIKELL